VLKPANWVQPLAVASTGVIQFSNVVANEVLATPAKNRKSAISNRLFPEFAASPVTPRAGFSAAIGGMNGGPAPQATASFAGAIGSGVSDGQGRRGARSIWQQSGTLVWPSKAEMAS